MKSPRREKLATLHGYDATQNNAHLTLEDMDACDCGQPATRLAYVVVGCERQTTEPLPLCEDCYELHIQEEERTP